MEVADEETRAEPSTTTADDTCKHVTTFAQHCVGTVVTRRHECVAFGKQSYECLAKRMDDL